MQPEAQGSGTEASATRGWVTSLGLENSRSFLLLVSLGLPLA